VAWLQSVSALQPQFALPMQTLLFVCVLQLVQLLPHEAFRAFETHWFVLVLQQFAAALHSDCMVQPHAGPRPEMHALLSVCVEQLVQPVPQPVLAVSALQAVPEQQ
jgi:hypothetical protein